MQASDIAALPVRFGAALRQGRLFHPAGVLAEGIFERVAPPGVGLPMKSCDVIGRISKGVGLPGALPDIAGLAWRIPPPQDLSWCGPWDVLLASTFAGSRIILAPVTSWSGATFSSLMPLRFKGRTWWVRARLVSEFTRPGLSLGSVSTEIDSDAIVFAIEQAAGFGGFSPLAQLTLRHTDPSRDDIGFDPLLHTDPDVRLLPGWLADFRRVAYRRSREGRDPR